MNVHGGKLWINTSSWHLARTLLSHGKKKKSREIKRERLIEREREKERHNRSSSVGNGSAHYSMTFHPVAWQPRHNQGTRTGESQLKAFSCSQGC